MKSQKLKLLIIASMVLFISACVSTPSVTPSDNVVLKPDQYPIFPGCESVENSQRANCFSRQIGKFFSRRFNTDIANEYNLEGIQRSLIVFIVNANGELDRIKIDAPHPVIEKEIMNILDQIPPITAGTYQGKKVAVRFALPFVFKVNG